VKPTKALRGRYSCIKTTEIESLQTLQLGVAKAAVLARRLGVVTWLAHRLPVGAIPEQLLVTAVAYHMVNHRRRCRASNLSAR
jgi:hypothetical protein